jgi:peroxiredoxin
MVTCERCHRKFSSYSALLQHYKVKHSNVTNLSDLEARVAAEKETESLYRISMNTRGPSRLKLLAFLLIVIIAISVTGYLVFVPKEAAAKRLGIGEAAPNFTLPDTNGGTFTLSDYRGKEYVLLFFNEGLSCQPCVAQMKNLDQLNSQFSALNVLVVSVTPDPMNLLSYWTQSNGPRYGMVLSDQGLTVSKMYDMLDEGVSMIPGTAPGHTFLLVNKSGVIVWRGDFGPYNMNVSNDQIISAVRRAIGA